MSDRLVFLGFGAFFMACVYAGIGMWLREPPPFELRPVVAVVGVVAFVIGVSCLWSSLKGKKL